jgi:hypothetical protein
MITTQTATEIATTRHRNGREIEIIATFKIENVEYVARRCWYDNEATHNFLFRRTDDGLERVYDTVGFPKFDINGYHIA